MKTVIMTDLRTRAAQEAAEYLKMQGYAVLIVPEDIPLWDEAALSAWAEPFRDELIGVIHPAPPVQTGGLLRAGRKSVTPDGPSPYLSLF